MLKTAVGAEAPDCPQLGVFGIGHGIIRSALELCSVSLAVLKADLQVVLCTQAWKLELYRPDDGSAFHGCGTLLAYPTWTMDSAMTSGGSIDGQCPSPSSL